MTLQKQLVDIRFCVHCGWIIPRRPYDGPSGYQKRKYCSQKCVGSANSIRHKRYTDNYYTLHWRVRQTRGPASSHECEECGYQAYDWAMLHGTDGQNPADFQPMCRKCHMAYDDHVGSIISTKRETGNYGWTPERKTSASQKQRQYRASLTPEQESEMAAKIWETRRQKREIGE